MSKHLKTPTTRLICLGGAKLATNAGFLGNDEQDGETGYPD